MLKKQFWIDEKSIRSALKRKLSLINHATIEEVAVNDGVTRIDVIAISDYLHGYEVKSDFDCLDRLENQINSYAKVFDRISLVVGYRYAKKVINIIPEWWGIEIAEKDTMGNVSLFTYRESSSNPCLEIKSMLRLLDKKETQLISEDLIPNKNGTTKANLQKHILEILNEKVLKNRILDIFKTKYLNHYSLS